jgi:hypothetical protein
VTTPQTRFGSLSTAMPLPALALLLSTAFLAAPAWADDVGTTVATVNGEPITSDDLFRQIGAMHGGMQAPEGMVSRPDPAGVLERMIDVKLVVQEARNIGLDELPDVQAKIENGRADLIRTFLAEHAVRSIESGDPEFIEQAYREIVLEVGVDSVLFENEEAARTFLAALDAGNGFRAQAAEAIGRGEARGAGDTQYLRVAELQPAVAEALRDVEPGAVVGPVAVSDGSAVIHFVERRVPEDADVRKKVEKQALAMKQQERLQQYMQEMRDRYVEIDQELLDGLDYDGHEGDLTPFLEDERVVARVKGAEPVTVADLTEGLQQKFFHGLEGATGRKRVNQDVAGVLDRLVLQRASELEADRLGIQKSADFQGARKDQIEGILFGAFLNRVINPDVTLDEPELEAYYAEHVADYSSPMMMRLDSIAFGDRASAEAALSKLTQGADLKWMRRNAAGRLDPADVENLLALDGDLLAVPALDPGIQRALQGASAGELRFYAADEASGPYYVLSASEVFPPKPRPYAEVREEVAKKVFVRKRQQVLDQWVAELRKASEIEVVTDEEQLLQILGLGAAEGT